MGPKKLVTFNLDAQTRQYLRELAEDQAEGNQSLMARMLIRRAFRHRRDEVAAEHDRNVTARDPHGNEGGGRYSPSE